MPRTHVPVLAGELIEALDPRPGQIAIDCTLGAGGHAHLVADRIGPTGTLIAIDRDPLAEESFARLSADVACTTRFVRADFAHGLRTLVEEGVRADMVYMDLGMSSMQVDTRERGFSYAYDAPLDMRMDPEQTLTARELVNTWEQRRLARVLRQYGEERYADRIAREIVRRRADAELTTTFELVDAITAAIPAPARFGGGHPAKRTFQAIRIAVNDELGQLERGAPARVGGAAHRRPPRRDLLPLARGPARQALPRRSRARLHLPARPAGVRLRAHARSRAGVPPLGRPHAGGDRRQPPVEVGPPEGLSQARRGALVPPQTARRPHARPTHARTAAGRSAAPRHHRRVSGPARPSSPRTRCAASAPCPPAPSRAAGRCRAPASAPRPSSASAGCPTIASSTACCARAAGSS